MKLGVIAILAFGLSGCLAVVPVPLTIGTSGGAAPLLAAGPGSVDMFGQGLNAARASAGLGPVVLNPSLTNAAQAHAADMQTRGYFNHVSPEGRTTGQRARAQGYAFCKLAENIALGQKSEADVLAQWMASPGHRQNNLLPQVTEYGIGRAGDNWVLVLGRRC